MTKKTKNRPTGQRHPAQRRSARDLRPTVGSAPDDAILKEMRSASRAHLGVIWQDVRLGLPLTGEDALTARIMREHEEWYDVWDQLAADPSRAIEREGVNPALHIMLHGVIENQLAADSPKDVRLVLQALQRQGMDRHEAIHRIAAVQSEVMFLVLKERRPFDEAGYIRQLWELVEPDTAVQ